MLPLISSISNTVHDCIRKFDPTLNIVSVEQPRPFVATPNDDCTSMVLQAAPLDDLWEVDEIVDVGKASPLANLWDVDTIINVTVGDEVWIVNTALVDGGLWDVPFVSNPRIPFEDAAAQDPDFWEGLARSSSNPPFQRPNIHAAQSSAPLAIPIVPRALFAFTERDLRVRGVTHNWSLHITVKFKGHWVPIVLIDNGSAINVCPFRVAYRFGLTKKDLVPSNLAIKAYDSIRRVVEGMQMLKLNAQGFEMDVEFHVINIRANFDLLLGRPWLHRADLMPVPSTLHQKVMLGLTSETLTICGDVLQYPFAHRRWSTDLGDHAWGGGS
ncbi:hypothetical protein RHMOL_Rhmol05G0157200 [Rhododendron molle]|uniref:Uncharacterized protein n=1 Tax=Rhododendron molle TaxID=49168 RepID=A0ACC0NPN7_RHOML|nr:hypothetical protein RHMOL_Rhmol05G0157200 [Rhododendron molle]